MIDLDITLVIQLVNFLVTLVVLNYLLIRPIRGIMRKRQETLDHFAEEASQLNARAEKAMADYQHALDDAHEDGIALREMEREESEEARQAMLAAATSEANEHIRDAAYATAAEVAHSRDAIRAELPEIVQSIVAKLVGADQQPNSTKA